MENYHLYFSEFFGQSTIVGAVIVYFYQYYARPPWGPWGPKWPDLTLLGVSGEWPMEFWSEFFGKSTIVGAVIMYFYQFYARPPWGPWGPPSGQI